MASSLPTTQGTYVLARRHANLIFTAGMTPRDNGVLMFTGVLAADAPIESLRDAVVLATRNAVEAAKSVLAPSECITQILNTTVYVAAQSSFTRHTAVADFASAYLRETFGEAGVSARTAIGVASLPGNAPVEIQLVVEAGAGGLIQPRDSTAIKR